MPRLYRNVLLLECADETTLDEVLASLPTRYQVWRLNERTMALDPEADEEIIALLRRAGLTPKVVGA